VSDLIEVGTWAQIAAFVAVCATLLLLYLRFRPAKTGEVRLRGAAGPKVRTRRAWGPFGQGKSSGLPERFQRMDDAEFEVEVGRILRDLGYSVRPTPPSNIQDVDLLLQMTGCRVAVQLKRWNAPVGHRSVYGLFTGRIHYGTDEAWLITTSRFTPKARKLAETAGVRLVDGDELAQWLDARREEGKSSGAQMAVDERIESVNNEGSAG
jgi:restriction endonuclease